MNLDFMNSTNMSCRYRAPALYTLGCLGSTPYSGFLTIHSWNLFHMLEILVVVSGPPLPSLSPGTPPQPGTSLVPWLSTTFGGSVYLACALSWEVPNPAASSAVASKMGVVAGTRFS